MEPSTITNRTLEITGMNGDQCVQKVSGALKNVAGVTTQSVKVGSASIVADAAGASAASAAIETAGYKARERSGATASSSTSAPKTAGGACPSATTQSSPTNASTIPLEPKQAELKPIVAGAEAVAAGPKI